MQAGEVIGTEEYHSFVEGKTFVWDRVYIKTEQVSDTKLHYLPAQQCPVCGDIGQHIYPDPERKGWHIFYCPYCYIHYRIIRKEVPNAL